MAERIRAGAHLAERLEQLRRDEPDAAIYVIAHSHGGSVFAHAMKIRPTCVDQIDGFIALATPWLDVRPCSYATDLRQLTTRLALVAAFVLALWTALPLLLNYV